LEKERCIVITGAVIIDLLVFVVGFGAGAWWKECPVFAEGSLERSIIEERNKNADLESDVESLERQVRLLQKILKVPVGESGQ